MAFRHSSQRSIRLASFVCQYWQTNRVPFQSNPLEVRGFYGHFDVNRYYPYTIIQTTYRPAAAWQAFAETVLENAPLRVTKNYSSRGEE